MPGMDSTFEEVGPTEGTILALLDFLVDPLLPSRSSSSREIISPSQEELVAKQVHAVVLLYNYYHRKRHPELEFLEFLSFCKMAVVLKPSLLSYLKLMQREDSSELDDLDKQLSLTEKAILKGCDICKSLDASNGNPVIEGWPITKIAVFLVDSNKENCYLFHSSITQGVWSAIEKDVNDPNQSSEAVTDVRPGNKKKRITKRAPKENQTADEANLQQLACLAVKEACGINQADLKTLENHMVYSTGEKKTAVRLYIMQCTQTNQDMNLVPINDALESLHGPLVIKESGSWITTPVVEYFHLLPFADKVTDWLCREGLINTSKHLEVAKEDGNCNSFHLKVEPVPDTSQHFQAVKEVENCNSANLKVESLPRTSLHFRTEKGDENNNFQFTVEPLPSTSHHFQTVKEVHNDSRSHLEVEPPPSTSDHIQTVKEGENGNSLHLEVEPLPNTFPEAVKEEVEKYSGSLIKEEHLLDASQPSTVAKEVRNDNSHHSKEETLQETLQHSEAAKEVEGNTTCRRKEERTETVATEEQLLDASQPSAVAKEVRIDNSHHSNEEALQYTLQHSEVEKEMDGDTTCLRKEERTETVVKEENLLDASHPSAVVKEVRNDNSHHLKVEALPYTLQHSEAAKEVEGNTTSCRKEKRTETVVYKKRNRSQKNSSSRLNLCCKTSNATTKYPRQEDKECALTGSSNNMDVDESVMTCSPVNGQSKVLPCENHVDNQKQMILAEKTNQSALTGGAIVVAAANDNLPSSNEQNVEKVFSNNKITDTAMSEQDEKQERALVSFNPNFEHLHKIHLTIASKKNLLSQTALKVLFRKREILSQQLRSVEDDIALCERNIQTILSGDEDDLAVKLDSLIEGCYEMCSRSVAAAEDRTGLQFSDQDLPPVTKRKRLSEANLCVHNPCQDLDGICNENSWMLPNYQVSVSEGGFQASVTVKGVDFECSSEGGICTTPFEARNSAASKTLVKLRNMAAES